MLMKFFSRNKDAPAMNTVTDSGEGYAIPLTVNELMGNDNRQSLLKQIRKNLKQTDKNWQLHFLPPLNTCISLMQQIPFTSDSNTPVIDYMLNLVSNSLKLSAGVTLQKHGSSEDKAANSIKWNAVVFYAALFYYLSVPDTLRNNSSWQPATKLLTDQITQWLADPKTNENSLSPLDTLLHFLAGHYQQTDILSSLIFQADSHVKKILLQKTEKTTTKSQESQPGSVISATISATVSADYDEKVTQIASALDKGNSSKIETVMPHTETQSSDEKAAINKTLSLITTNKNKSGDTETTEAEQFLSWLLDSVKSKRIPVNQPGGILHIINDEMFIRSPAIFNYFLKECAINIKKQTTPETQKELQRSFERLSVHTVRQGKGMFSFTLRRVKEPDQITFEKVSGYLIKLKLIFQDCDIPYENSENLSYKS